MRAPRLALAAALFACVAAPVAQAKPKPDKPVIVTRNFLVTTILSGTYHGETHYESTDDGFCPGSGSVIDAAFHVVGTAKLHVKLDTTSSAHADLNVTSVGDNDFMGDLATVAMGDDCSAMQNFHCTGATGELKGAQSNDFAYAQGAGHRMVFGTEFTGQPGIDPDYTCFPTEGDYYPGFAIAGLGDATGPYVSASSAFSLTKLNDLKVGQQRKRTFNPLKGRTPDDYDVATCNGAGECTGSLNNFAHTITVKRIK